MARGDAFLYFKCEGLLRTDTLTQVPMSHYLSTEPSPDIVKDPDLKLLFIFGGVRFHDQKGSANEPDALLQDLVDVLDDIAPLADDMFRVDVRSQAGFDKLTSSIRPAKPRRKYFYSGKMLRQDLPFYSSIQVLKNVILRGMMEGRHSAFALQPEKQRLLFLHQLDKRLNPTFPAFLGDLQLNILRLATNGGKIHFLSEARKITITGVLDKDLSAFADDDLFRAKNIYI